MVILWALDCAKVPLEQVEATCPDEKRPRLALELCEAWAKGNIKMPLAKKAILQAHAVAKETDRITGALCHGIGHVGATVHVKSHALGLPMYELTALGLTNRDDYEKPLLEMLRF